jgi:hypothetical protein
MTAERGASLNSLATQRALSLGTELSMAMVTTLALIGIMLFVVMVLPNDAFAAVSRIVSSDKVLPHSSQSTREALTLSLEERVSTIRNQGDQGAVNLVKIMSDRNQPMEIRWRAVTALGRVRGSDAKNDLTKILKSQEWFLRNAGLLTMARIDRETALNEARRLLSDPALVVRSAAVDVIADLGDLSSAGLLWEKLHSKENFKRGQSLFIRRRIVETLARLESPGREGRFIELLTDRDPSLHEPAMSALERLTNRKMGTASQSLSDQRAQWQRWWRETTKL